ncbi:unnamed protein product, partial [Hapterophycus canaliculatus]
QKGAIGEAKFIRTLRQIENEAIQAPSAKAGASPLSEEELADVVREFSTEGSSNGNGGEGGVDRGSRGDKKVLYDDFVDMLVVASPRFRCSTADADARRGRKKGRSPAKRRMSMSMVLPEGPVRRHRYQPPPTVHSYLNRMNEAEFDFHGDTNKQLARAMKAFSSSFARANRRKLLRKHFLAFDVNNTRRISRAQFVETVNEVALEFFIDFDKRNKELLAAFFFPKEHGRVEYETLLEIITARDVRRAHAFRQQTVDEGADFDELFTGIDNTARKRDFGGTLNLFATAY